MNRIDDTTLSIVLKLAAKAAVKDDVEKYDNLDVSDCEVGERVRRRFKRDLVWEFGRQKRSKITAVSKNVAVVCLVVCMLLFGTAMCIEPIRAAVIEAVVTWYEDYIGFRFAKKEKVEYPSTIEKVYLPEVLPDEWTVTKIYQRPTGVAHRICGPNNENIRLEQLARTTSIGATVDDTGAEVNKIELENGLIGYLISYSTGAYTLIWYEDYLFEMIVENASIETAYHIVNSLK